MKFIVAVVSIFFVILIRLTRGQYELESATITSFEGFGDLTNVISTDRTKANLSCESGDMVVKLQFSQPFRGIIYADRDRNSPCKKHGDGSTYYVYSIPLQGCGTKERVTKEYRMFVNDIVVRFHPSLELEGDEVKTILCRYPPPVAPLPPVPPPPLPPDVPAVVEAGPRRLSEVELMLIICAILFLGLLLLGVGLAYYCLKKRNIKIIKRRTLSSGPPSQITKLSGSTLGPLSIPFDGIRIPRAIAHSTSGSEAALLTSASIGEHSDTITSDYPSESPSSMHSDVEEVETRSMHMSSTQMTQKSYENQGFTLHDEETMMSKYASQRQENERMVSGAMTVPSRSLTTIREQESLHQQEEFRRIHAAVTQPQEIVPPVPKHASDPPVYARIRKRQMEQHLREENTSVTEEMEEITRFGYPPPPQPQRIVAPAAASIPDNDLQSVSEYSESVATRSFTAHPQRHPPRVNEATEVQETRNFSEYVQETHTHSYPQQYIPEYQESRTTRSLSEMEEPPAVMTADDTIVTTKASPTRHLIDDRYLTTVTETRTSEDMTRTIKDITTKHVKPVPPPTWDVMIRTYPPEQGEDTVDGSSEVETWEKFSVVSERPQTLFEPTEDPRVTTEVHLAENSHTISELPPPNWDVLIRVLDPPNQGDTDDVHSMLSEDDRGKWKAILSTDSTLRTLLTEARTVEEFEMIRHDERYEQLFEPPKWDVIIRILATPPDSHYDSPDTSSIGDTASYTSERPAVRYRRKSDFDIRSRRSSLPPLYEHDGPGRPSVGPESYRSRRSSRSSTGAASTTDDEAYFARYERESIYSDDSGGIRAGMMSDPDDQIAHSRLRFHRPSLMRSTSEVLQGLETIEKDSLDGRSSEREFRVPIRRDGTILYERYPHTSPDQSPSSSPPISSRMNHHRRLERSSTEMTVNSQSFSSRTDREELHSLAETDISDQWVH